MIAKVVPLDADGHLAIQAMLPWYAAGTLDRAETADIELHLANCAQCRDELAWERRMYAAHASEVGASAVAGVDRGLAQMRTRIEAARLAKDSPQSGLPTPGRSRWQSLAPWLRWTLGLQLAAILLMTVLLVVPQERSQLAYRALGAPTQAGRANLVVRFRPDAEEREIRRALQDAGARLVDGPTVTDAYLLSVPASHQAAALAGLRATPIVVLAESLDAGPRP